jgi:hypothetical protein
MIEVIEVNYGIASRYDGLIELNKKIKDPLKSKILKHEFSHTEGKYTIEDYKVDFQSKDSFFYDALKFALKNPEALINYMPLMYSYYFRVFTYNVTGMIAFLSYGIVATILISLLFGVKIYLTGLFVINFIVLLNLSLLLYTHIYVRYVKRIVVYPSRLTGTGTVI